MNPSAERELRVLTGVHAGARAPLAPGEHLIGSDPGCDFVLVDAGVRSHHARLTVHGTQVACILLDDAGHTTALEPGDGIALGETVVAVDRPSAPWIAQARLRTASRPPAPEAAARDGPNAAPDAASAGPGQPSADEAGATPAGGTASAVDNPPAASTRTGATAVPALIASGVLLAAAALVWALWQALADDSDAHAPPQAVSAEPAGTSDAQRRAIAEVLVGLGLHERVRVERDDSGQWLASAVFLTEEEALALGTALARLSPRPGLRIGGEAELAAALADIRSQAGVAFADLELQVLGPARVALAGTVDDRAQQHTLLERLKAAFPGLAFESRLNVRQDVADRLLAELRASGVAEVRGHWQEGRLLLTARMSQNDVPRWERALLAATRRHPVPFSASLDIRTAEPPEASIGRLPFRLASVVSGSLSYVVLEDGSKLVPGARRDGWELVDVGRTAVVFENGSARRLSVPR